MMVVLADFYMLHFTVFMVAVIFQSVLVLVSFISASFQLVSSNMIHTGIYLNSDRN